MKKSRPKKSLKPKGPAGAGTAPKPARAPRSEKSYEDAPLFRIKLRGRDNAPLSDKDIQQVMIEATKFLKKTACRAKWITISGAAVDGNGAPARISESNELTLYPYPCAADEHGA